MEFDVEIVLDAMLEAAAGVLSAEWPKVKECAKVAFEEEREAISEIAKARLDGEIDDIGMESELSDEKDVLTAALRACQVQAKAASQKAANAAIKVLSDAINGALKPL